MRSIIIVITTPFGVLGGVFGLIAVFLVFGAGDQLVTFTQWVMAAGGVIVLAGLSTAIAGGIKSNEEWTKAGGKVALFGLCLVIGAPIALTVLIAVAVIVFLAGWVAFLSGGL